MKNLKGVFAALLIPYKKDGSIDEQALKKFIDYNIEISNVDGLYVNGSTGEAFLLSNSERKQILEIVAKHVNKRVPLIAQVGSLNIYESIEQAKLAEQLGYDAISAVTPFYYKFNLDQILNYYKEIKKATNLPLIAYYIPLLSGVNFSLEAFEKLFAIDGVIGVKFTATDLYTLERIKAKYPDKLVFYGFDEQQLSASIYNIDGVIGSTFNVNAKRAKQLFELVKNGQNKQALELQNQINDFIDIVLANGLYAILKEIIRQHYDLNEVFCRLPMTQSISQYASKAKEIKEKYLKDI
ncbi:N-acetylneuraminate lyase [Mycoplasma feriruminatoris]|uniref:N-acetylneuraminate lyase n=1 Tax=Mycoplasma feriruminatoris TaxID=1179777 RepID=A0AAQ3DM28_9MOLU|nr:N-acetylneuraminate lyase [Mycoplasma feriruminatoris]UKS54047.1 N-acetylneuraminate lyase [Mycoplasma feriruminatoris]WFQ90933.1 N-acetylneuraminate lyase [Mycoplasma feriruminatoris]WFQ91755.1 N-acetylneuraminate lyase [Mycoplasma feriruminatoris]WFQ94287.1 N-acetylneuraminate lyase [Mycoplasma feriruminatoris]WFQ95110.1 N-acetylneuraminate lyase [Mycoplasma feriruminatoris]